MLYSRLPPEDQAARLLLGTQAQFGGCRLMFTTNHFAELSAFIPPSVMQTYVVIMILLVAGGTLLDR